MKINLLAVACALIMSSCVHSDQDGRVLLTLPIAPPNHPLREALIHRPMERYAYRKWVEQETARMAPPKAVPMISKPPPVVYEGTVVQNELSPPPPGYMFSTRMLSSNLYEMRGITGPAVKLSAAEYKEFVKGSQESGWMVRAY